MAQFSVKAQLSEYGPAARSTATPTLSAAVAYCRQLALQHYENFTVASWLLPRALRPHFYAIYAYCRWADDLADETGGGEHSLELLDWWGDQLARCYEGTSTHPVFVALAATIEQFSIPHEPFERLLIAFRQDQLVHRYATHQAVLAYCQNSANPVGRLILYLGRCHDTWRGAMSDSICTGLQLANFCQDVVRDGQRGRQYLPTETLVAAGCAAEDLLRPVATPAMRQALRREVDRAEGFLRAGQPLIASMPRALRLDVALFQAGGLAILRAIRRQDCDVWRSRPTVSKTQKLGLLARCWWQGWGLARQERHA